MLDQQPGPELNAQVAVEAMERWKMTVKPCGKYWIAAERITGETDPITAVLAAAEWLERDQCPS